MYKNDYFLFLISPNKFKKIEKSIWIKIIHKIPLKLFFDWYLYLLDMKLFILQVCSSFHPRYVWSFFRGCLNIDKKKKIKWFHCWYTAITCVGWFVCLETFLCQNFATIGIRCNNKAIRYRCVAVSFFLDILFFMYKHPKHLKIKLEKINLKTKLNTKLKEFFFRNK